MLSKGAIRLSLRVQLLWALALSAALPVLVFGLVQADAWSESEAARAARETLLASAAISRELGRELDAHADVVRAMAAEFAERGHFQEPELGRTLRRYRQSFPGFYMTLAIGADGVTVMADPPTGTDGNPVAGISYRDRPYFKQILAGSPLSVSDMLKSRTTGRPAVIMVAPIRDASGKLWGVASAGVDLSRVEQAVSRVTSAVPELSGVVLDGASRIVASSGDRRFSPLTPLGHLPLYRPAAGPTPERRQGDDGARVIRLGTLAPVQAKVVEWSVLAALPEASVQKRATRAFLIMAAFAAFAVLLGLAVAALMSRWIAEPVTTAAILVDAIGRGDLRVKPNPPERWHAREILDLGSSVKDTLSHLLELVTELRETAVAVSGVTRELRGASTQMVSDSRAQEQAVRTSSGAIVQISDSIGDVTRGIRELAGSATETHRAIVSFERQIEQIVGSLQTLTHAIEQASLDIGLVAEQVDAVSESANRLGGSVEHTAESLGALADSIGVVSNSAERSQALANETLIAAQAGNSAVDGTIEATRAIGENFRAVHAAVRRLADRSDAIEQVTAVISEVARETHVLAINASIIASQSGEHGSRFSVVAERVRMVARETASSTQEISELVAAVQLDIRQAVQAVELGQTTVVAGEERSEQAGRRLRLIIDTSAQAELQVRKIAEATREQSERVQAVHSALEDVRDATVRIDAAAGAQRSVHQKLDGAMLQVRTVGDDVRRSTEAQRNDSRAMTHVVQTITERLSIIANAIRAQHGEREHIAGSLDVFNKASVSSVERAIKIERAVVELSEHLVKLERQMRSFQVD